jgi:hypothetical protein
MPNLTLAELVEEIERRKEEARIDYLETKDAVDEGYDMAMRHLSQWIKERQGR